MTHVATRLAAPQPLHPRPSGGFLGRAAEAGVMIDTPVVNGALVVDLTGYTVTLDGVLLDLSPRQVELLALFLAAPGRVWSRDQLHWVCWDDTMHARDGDQPAAPARRPPSAARPLQAQERPRRG
jgi:hypothetical protein